MIDKDIKDNRCRYKKKCIYKIKMNATFNLTAKRDIITSTEIVSFKGLNYNYFQNICASLLSLI